MCKYASSVNLLQGRHSYICTELDTAGYFKTSRYKPWLGTVYRICSMGTDEELQTEAAALEAKG